MANIFLQWSTQPVVVVFRSNDFIFDTNFRLTWLNSVFLLKFHLYFHLLLLRGRVCAGFEYFFFLYYNATSSSFRYLFTKKRCVVESIPRTWIRLEQYILDVEKFFRWGIIIAHIIQWVNFPLYEIDRRGVLNKHLWWSVYDKVVCVKMNSR